MLADCFFSVLQQRAVAHSRRGKSPRSLGAESLPRSRLPIRKHVWLCSRLIVALTLGAGAWGKGD